MKNISLDDIMKKLKRLAEMVFFFVVLHFIKIREFLERITGIKSSLLMIPGLILTGLVLIFIILPILCVATLYKSLVYLYLKIVHGSKFVGLITGCDAAHVLLLEPHMNPIINVIFLIRSDSKGYEFLNEMKAHIWKNVHAGGSDQKLHSVRERKLGYYYCLKANFNEDDVFRVHTCLDKTVLNDDEFVSELNLIFDTSLPLENKFNWDVTFLAQPVRQDNVNYYALVCRLHHTIADAMSSYSILTEWLTQNIHDHKEEVDKIIEGLQAKSPHRFNLRIQNDIKATTIDILSYIPNPQGSVYYFYREIDLNYVRKVKEIRRVHRVSFFTVLLTTLSASLKEYFDKHKSEHQTLPEYVNLMSPIQVNPSRMQEFYTNSRRTRMGNDLAQ